MEIPSLSLVEIHQDSFKAELAKSLSQYAKHNLEVDDSFRLKVLSRYPRSAYSLLISDLKTNPSRPDIPSSLVYTKYRKELPASPLRYRTEKMMLGVGNNLRCNYTGKELLVYPHFYYFNDSDLSFLREYIPEPSLGDLARERASRNEKVGWKDIEKVLEPLSFLHISTPFIAHNKKESPFPYSLEIMTDPFLGMGDIFARAVRGLLEGSEKPMRPETYEGVKQNYSKLARNIFDKGSLGVIHGNLNVNSITTTRLLYGDETRIGPFFCDLALFLQPPLLGTLNLESICERVELLSREFPRIRKYVESCKCVADSDKLYPLPKGREFVVAQELAAIWGWVTEAHDVFHYLSGYALGSGYASDKDEINSHISNSISLTEKLLGHLREDKDYGSRSKELYQILESTGFFEPYSLKKQGPVVPLKIQTIPSIKIG